ncbi:hypothetical protein CYMTET_7159 [Cymbomonas tetramitiformis]|uniref:Uncharacterized protein n=1 Tax=Cymbomonas tetramitiformis TaxID=36881 RepID=A0AAE0GVI7_9CHLO|nr:hypothetical protein CYMTET_7159 [Cymbomonas tetramitiformis]
MHMITGALDEIDYDEPESWYACYAFEDKEQIPYCSPLGVRKAFQSTRWHSCSLLDQQDAANADVFYVHPTVTSDLADLEGNISMQQIEGQIKDVIAVQAGCYNGSCRIYSPKYRYNQELYQVIERRNTSKSADNLGILDYFTLPARQTLGTSQSMRSNALRKDVDGDAFETAYSDIFKAFFHYLDNFNDGRPYILAGDGRGSQHLLRLIQDVEDFDEAPLHNLVAAYLLGCQVNHECFKKTPLCSSPYHTGCVISFPDQPRFQILPQPSPWFEPEEKAYPFPTYTASLSNAVCTNPLFWESTVGKEGLSSLHLGALGPDNLVHAGLIRAVCRESGKLELMFVDQRLGSSLYELSPFELFWLDIRENVSLRIAAKEFEVEAKQKQTTQNYLLPTQKVVNWLYQDELARL